MRRTLAIAQRELTAIFLSPIAYIVVAVFAVLNGFVFWAILEYYSQPGAEGSPFSLVLLNVYAWIFLLLTVPAITMRLFAEERRSGTIETLFTAPVTPAQAVVGKFVAGYVFYLCLWLPTLIYVVILLKFSSPDWRPMVTGYLGMVLLGAMFVAVGEFTSALSRSQIVAYMTGAALLLCLFMAGLLLPLIVKGSEGSQVLGYFDLFRHMVHFSEGIVDSRRAVYYLSATVFFLFLASRAIDSRKGSALG